MTCYYSTASSVVFKIPGTPKGKGRHRTTQHGITYTPKDTVMYENLVKLACSQVCKGQLEGQLIATICAVFPIPKSTNKKRQADMISGAILPTTKPDCDNIAKIILDALNGIAYHDDSQICELNVLKKFGENPHVIVTVEGYEKVLTEEMLDDLDTDWRKKGIHQVMGCKNIRGKGAKVMKGKM